MVSAVGLCVLACLSVCLSFCLSVLFTMLQLLMRLPSAVCPGPVDTGEALIQLASSRSFK